MKKICLLLSLACLIASAQAQVQHRKCGSSDALDLMIQDNPAIAITRQAIEEQTQKYITERGVSASRSSITIPVVVHVVYSADTQNISDAQILSQIAILNADYGATNSDRAGTPSAFLSVSGTPGIQFCLAQRDPGGNATTGIVRKSTTTTSFTITDAVKYSNQGGDDAWPSSSYLNLWVCNLGSGLLGYSHFPGGAAATDGVVINYTAFGNTGTVTAPYGLGRTATHEIGHWLNLYHIWGDDNGGCTGTDHVDDTPNQAGENFGCPSFPHVSCTNGPDGDMFMNFMDYSDDACMFMFSAGQSTRMQSLFAPGGARASLLSSMGCTPPTAGSNTSCTTPSALTSGIVYAPSDTIKWSSVTGATSYILEYKPTNSSVWASTTATAAAKTLSGLTPGTTYNYHVEAVCNASVSNYSAVNSFTAAPNENAVSTGVIDASAQVEYKIYPNPSNGTFHLMIAAAERSPLITVRITDMMGRTIQTLEYENVQGLYSYEITIPNATTGIYDIAITNGQSTTTRKVIVQK